VPSPKPDSGETISFSRKDDGADLVESAFMFEGLLAAHQYFNKDNQVERRIRHNHFPMARLCRNTSYHF